MVTRHGKFLLGVLVGTGVGLTAALLLVSRRRLPQILPLERSRDEADRARASKNGRRIRRAGKALDKRIDRMRSAGL